MKIHPKYSLTLAFLLLGVAISPAQEDLLGALNETTDSGLENIEDIPAPLEPGDLPAMPQPGESLETPQTEVPEIPEVGELEAPPVAESELPVISGDEEPITVDGDPGAAPFAPLEEQKKEMETAKGKKFMKGSVLNEIFQYLALSAGKQYFYNLKIEGPEYMVTGHLDDNNPLNQMEELAFMYGLSLHTKGNTIYALTPAQLSQLPSTEFHYQLQYLRPTDIEQIKELIKPMLSPGTGVVNFEPKTNTIIIIDTATRIEATRKLLHGIDKAKGQIVVETKILRVNSNNGIRNGVDWTSSLGNGIGINVARDLNSVFGLPNASTASNIVLSPVGITGVLRALNSGNLTKQISNPIVITEDNEQASIAITERIPIITSTSTASGGNVPPTVSEEVRYKIDPSDKAITEDAENHREIGISLVVTPTLLPDGTIRMKMRPRSAQITGYVIGQGAGNSAGNRYPQVTESMIETLARIPDGYSLVVGGFYGEIQTDAKAKVPGFGDLPIINFFFKSKEAAREQTSLVFIVTPKSYNPVSGASTNGASENLRMKTELPRDFNWVDPANPGPAHEPNLRRTLRGIAPTEAPYYPRADEMNAPAPKPKKARFSSARR